MWSLMCKTWKSQWVKYLGLKIDHRLRWDAHVNYTNGILRKFFYIFHEARYILDVNYKRIIYLALVQSIFSYGIPIWGGACNSIVHNLNVTINGINKYLLNLPLQTNTILIYEKLNVNNFKVVYNQAVLVHLFKHKHLIPVSDHDHNTRYKQNVNIRLFKCQKAYGQKSVLYTGLNLCPVLNININQFENLKSFKTYLRHVDLLKKMWLYLLRLLFEILYYVLLCL